MKRVINGKTYSKVLGIKQGSLLTAGKDGDIEEYKADPADAGKVLTVGEDGSIILAKASGGDIPVRKITVTPDTVTEITVTATEGE